MLLFMYLFYLFLYIYFVYLHIYIFTYLFYLLFLTTSYFCQCQPGVTQVLHRSWLLHSPCQILQLWTTPTSYISDGIKARYYSDMQFSNLYEELVLPTVDASWGNGNPIPGVSNSFFSMTYSGYLKPDYNGWYSFRLYNGGFARLRINRILLIDNTPQISLNTWYLFVGQYNTIKFKLKW